MGGSCTSDLVVLVPWRNCVERPAKIRFEG